MDKLKYIAYDWFGLNKALSQKIHLLISDTGIIKMLKEFANFFGNPDLSCLSPLPIHALISSTPSLATSKDEIPRVPLPHRSTDTQSAASEASPQPHHQEMLFFAP